MIKINVITLFPELIEKQFNYLPFKKALEKKLIQIQTVNLRNYAVDSYGSVDDKPYGGGVGMILRIEPIYHALESLNLVESGSKIELGPRRKIILLSPKGKKYTQNQAKKYANLDELTLICGRYEGVDARVEQYADESISIGDYILSGGELGALVIMESMVRLIPGVLEKEEAVKIESFSQKAKQYEYPQYTRPENFLGLPVPKVLLSGDHSKIAKWREENSKNIS